MKRENREEYHERKDPEWRVNALSSNSNHASSQYPARNDWTPPIPSFPICKTCCLPPRLGIKLKTGKCTRKGFGSIHLCIPRRDYYIQTELSWCFWTVLLEKTLESHLDSKEIKTINPKGISPEYWMNWCWSWSSNTLATWCKELTQWKIPWSWERLRAKGETGCWNDWTASPTQWTWIWANSGR